MNRYTIRQIQAVIHVSRDTIVKQIQVHNLPYQKIDGIYYVDQKGFDYLKHRYPDKRQLKTSKQVCQTLNINRNQLYRILKQHQITPKTFNHHNQYYFDDQLFKQITHYVQLIKEKSYMYVGTYLNYVGDIVIDPDSMSINISQTEILLLTHLITNLNRVKDLNKPINQYTVAEKNQIFKTAGANVIKITVQNSDDLLQTLAET